MEEVLRPPLRPPAQWESIPGILVDCELVSIGVGKGEGASTWTVLIQMAVIA